MTETLTTTLKLTLRSAATFGRGDGIAGWIDREVEHDLYGFPYLRGRTLKGLLRESAEEVAFALGEDRWKRVKDQLFGVGSSNTKGQGLLHVSDARLPATLRELVREEMAQSKLKPDDVLKSLTGVRRQTAMNHYGAPDHATLRSMRVILRRVSFEAELTFPKTAEETAETLDDKWALLAAATLGLRAVGTGRNRGRGWLSATIGDEEMMRGYFNQLRT